MKSTYLRQLVKEELRKTLTESKSFISDLTPGKYKIGYKFKGQGEIGFSKIEIDITSKDIEMDGNMSIQNFINPDVTEGKVVSIESVEKVG